MHKCQLGTKLKLLPVFAEVILAVLDTPIEIAKAEKTLWNRNWTEMLIRDAVITTSGFYRGHFGGPKRSYWSGHSRKHA